MNDIQDRFIQSVKSDDLSLAKRLLDDGALVDQISPEDEENALHLAIEFDYSEMVKLLLENGANPNSIGYGQTAIQHAVDVKCITLQDDPGNNNMDIIHLLLKFRADPNMIGPTGKGATELAKFYQCQDVIRVLSS